MNRPVPFTPKFSYLVEGDHEPVPALVRYWRQNVCAYCKQLKRDHVDLKCLFDTTSFTVISFDSLRNLALQFSTQRELFAYIREQLKDEPGRDDR